MQLGEEIVVKGRSICCGIAIGKPFFLCRGDVPIFETRIPATQMQREIERYRYAIDRSKQDIKRLQKQLEIESAPEGIIILEAQLEMLLDPLLTTDIEKEIKKSKKNAEFIFQKALFKYQERFRAMSDSFFKERFQDLQDLSRRIFSYLYQESDTSLTTLSPHSVVFSMEITATDAASAHSHYVSAFVTESGGVTSHAAIVAKAKGIPYVTHVKLDTLKQNFVEQVIVDGKAGKIILNPSPETLLEYKHLKGRMQDQFKVLEQVIKWPAETYDGYSVRLSANLDMTHETDLIHELGGHGVGLFRSEYIFLPKDEIPAEEEQYKIYRGLIEQMKGLPVVIRTFDIGGDKSPPSFISLEANRSPFSGCSTRFLLKERRQFQAQLKAILRASVGGNVSILFPMISTLSELREAKKMLQEVREELGLFHPVRIGCMIEVPSAAIIVDHFAKECDFLSIGTNDLVQYAMAIDRTDSSQHESCEPTDPSIIRLIRLITDEANKARIPVSVCGEMASDPRFTSLLIGLGIQELSVVPRYLPVIKNAIRRMSIIRSVQLSEKALCMTTAKEVYDLISEDYRQKCPEEWF